MAQSGYSGTPLAKKLGIKEGYKIRLVRPPKNYFSLFDDFPNNVKILKDKKSKKDFIHYFTISTVELNKEIKSLQKEIEQNGMIWISWPKKSSNIQTNVTEHIVRDAGLKNGLVDIKVCAVDEIWSGLKFVIRVKDRK